MDKEHFRSKRRAIYERWRLYAEQQDETAGASVGQQSNNTIEHGTDDNTKVLHPVEHHYGASKGGSTSSPNRRQNANVTGPVVIHALQCLDAGSSGFIKLQGVFLF